MNTIVVARRFQGPPDSGNGGYVCGRLAAHLDADAVVARLRTPPPLETPLEVRATDDGVALHHGDAVVGTARAAPLALDVPAAPAFDAAETASRGYRGFDEHWYRACFVCGPTRGPGDGLCIFPGPLDDGRVAAPWRPDASLADAAGAVAPEFVWAALDCPGVFAIPAFAAAPMLLGELHVALSGPVAVGERCVVVAWEIEQRGRKHFTGSALYGASGACAGRALGTWFEVPGSPPEEESR